MRPVAARGRQPNAAYRIREHLTEDEMAWLLAALSAQLLDTTRGAVPTMAHGGLMGHTRSYERARNVSQ
jgi:hypothetical protein